MRTLTLGGAFVALVAGGILLIPTFRSVLNPDAVSYIAAAEHLADGEVVKSINPYWSPAFSWLLAPLVALGIDPLVAARIVSLLATWGLIAASWTLGRRLGLRTPGRVATALVAGIIGVSVSMTLVTPDLLVATVVIAYVAHETRPPGRRWVVQGVVAGALIGAGYLVKLYVLPALLLHLVCVHVGHAWLASPSRRAALLRLAVAGGTAVGIAVLWAGVLTATCGRFTFGTAGSYNLALKAPDVGSQPVDVGGLAEPNRAGAYSAWDDPTALAPTSSGWNVLSRDGFRHVTTVVTWNARLLWRVVADWSVAGVGLLLIAALFFAGARSRRRRRPFGIAALTMISFPSGYLATYVEARFVYPLQLLAFVFSALVVQAALCGYTGRAGWRLLVAMALLAGAFLPRPLRTLTAYAEGAPAANALRADAESSRALVPPGSRVASDGQWGLSMEMAYFAKWSYVGALPPNRTPDAWVDQLRRFTPDVLLLWDPKTAENLAATIEPLRTSSLPMIYRVRPRVPEDR
jgi:hypothetical protein